MAGFYLRGALVEYGTDVLGPLPNIVVFQFNPEQMVRTINLPTNERSIDPERASRRRETGQLSAPPLETFEISANFSAADDFGKGGAVSVIPRIFGIGPQLAALEKMAYPSAGLFSGLIGAAIDAVGDALGLGGDDDGRDAAAQSAQPAAQRIFQAGHGFFGDAGRDAVEHDLQPVDIECHAAHAAHFAMFSA